MKTISLAVIIETNNEDLDEGFIADHICSSIKSMFDIESVIVGKPELFEQPSEEILPINQ